MAEWDVEHAKDLVTELRGAEFRHLTNMGNGRWLVRLHGGDFRDCWLWESWMVFDGTAGRWTQTASFTAGSSA